MLSMNRQWASKSIKEVGKVITGTTPSKKHAKYYGGNIPFVTPRELGFMNPVEEAATYLSIAGAEKAKMIPKNSVMVCCIGSLGKVGIAGQELTTNQQINSIIFDETQVYPQYGFRFCQTLQPLLEHIAPSTTIAIVNKSRFENLKIPVPPLAEQKRIAAILDKADALRAKRRTALAKLDTLLQATFLDMFGDPVTNPMGWEVKKLGNVSKEIRYGTSTKCHTKPGNGEFPVLRIPNIIGGELDWSDLKFAALNQNETKKLLMKPGDLLFVRSNGNPEYIGRCAVFKERKNAAYASYLIRVRLNENTPLKADFIQQTMSFPTYRSFLIREARTTAGNYNISGSRMKILPLFIPPKLLQDEFLKTKEEVGSVRLKMLQELEKLDDLFHALQQRAFKGQL